VNQSQLSHLTPHHLSVSHNITQNNSKPLSTEDKNKTTNATTVSDNDINRFLKNIREPENERTQQIPYNLTEQSTNPNTIPEDTTSVLEKLNLRKKDTPTNGHCLLHAVALSWNEQIGPKTYEEVWHAVNEEAYNNINTYTAYTTRETSEPDEFLEDLNNYMENGIYNSEVGDVVPAIISNALNSTLHIIKEHPTGKCNIISIQPSTGRYHTTENKPIHIHLKLEHYKGLVPTTNKNNENNENSPEENTLPSYAAILKNNNTHGNKLISNQGKNGSTNTINVPTSNKYSLLQNLPDTDIQNNPNNPNSFKHNTENQR
jgi:hypothetical protein